MKSIYGPDGYVRRVITRVSSDIDLEQTLSPGEAIIDGESEPGVDRVLNGQLVRAAPQPSEFHTFNKTTCAWEADLEKMGQDILKKRQALLSSSDWTQLPDVPLSTKQYWAAYRQSLRDITEQPEYPFNVVWPSKPI